MSDVDQVELVMARMRAAGWRGDNEDRLRRTAVKRIAAAWGHAETAGHFEQLFSRLSLSEDGPPPARHLVGKMLEHQIRERACLGEISRAERDAALRMAPTFPLGADELIATVRSVLRP